MPGRRALAALARRVRRAAFPARAFSSSFGGAPATTTTTRPLRGSSGSAGASHPPRRSYASASSPEPSSSCLFARSLSALGDRHAPLASWLTPRLDASANGFAHPSLEARSVPGAGVGVFAAAPIPEGTAVLRVPRGAFEPLSAEYAVRTARRRAPPFVAHVERVAASAGAPAFATHALSRPISASRSFRPRPPTRALSRPFDRTSRRSRSSRARRPARGGRAFRRCGTTRSSRRSAARRQEPPSRAGSDSSPRCTRRSSAAAPRTIRPPRR